MCSFCWLSLSLSLSCAPSIREQVRGAPVILGASSSHDDSRNLCPKSRESATCRRRKSGTAAAVVAAATILNDIF